MPFSLQNKCPLEHKAGHTSAVIVPLEIYRMVMQNDVVARDAILDS